MVGDMPANLLLHVREPPHAEEEAQAHLEVEEEADDVTGGGST
jgi:hypothetical protein